MFDRIYALMAARGIKERDLASEIGVSYDALNGWESGRSKPGVEDLTALADFFGVTTDYIIGRDDRYPAPSPEGAELVRIFEGLDHEGRTVVLGRAYIERRRRQEGDAVHESAVYG